MRPLLQHASRSLAINLTRATSASTQSFREAFPHAPSICPRCQYRAASKPSQSNKTCSEAPEGWSRRPFSTSVARLEQRGPSNPPKTIPMPPPPTSESRSMPTGRTEDRPAETVLFPQGQERLQEDPDVSLQKQGSGKTGPEIANTSSEGLPAQSAVREPREPQDSRDPASACNKEEDVAGNKQEDVADNIARVPDEHLPSHRERQRWDFSKRLSELMDELLPKLAVVTQKVNTYTGTDYSGVEALRREIMEQEKLVKARRAAIDTAKQALDLAHAGQASAQKEVVALLERKHSWSAGDLERYMSLIRSEHINDQAIRHAKDRVLSAEAALEEARTQLEKRERAQYHEEQIWSDTIRRNSTWVTFVLMGVNIFLLLLSLAILEPWRRRRMVREIKSALEAQKVALEATPATATTATLTTLPQELTAMEEGIDKVFESESSAREPETHAVVDAVVDAVGDASLAVGGDIPSVLEPTPVATKMPQDVVDPVPDATVPGAAPFIIDQAVPQASIDIDGEVAASDAPPQGTVRRWQSKATAVAQDVISDRIISMRRIDYTTAILQGAAAGAVMTGAIIAMLRWN